MKPHVSLFLMSSLCVALVSCAAYDTSYKRQLVAEPDPVSLRLAEAADRASNALETLAAVEQTRGPAPAPFTTENAPRELLRTVTLDWVGPVEPLARRLADRAGYRFETLGERPPVPIVITVSANHRPVLELLRDIGLQSGARADVLVDADRQIVEVVYAPATGR